MSTGYGCITWWGFSPALDLNDVMNKYEVDLPNNKEVNILLVGGADGRHLFKTLPKLKAHAPKMNFYLVENNMEAIARHMLLTTLLFEPPNELSLQDKTELFLELFGNTLVRPQTDEYLRLRCNDFISWITNSNEVRDSIWDFSNLKFKERDELEAIFKLWRQKDHHVFDVIKLWDNRLRDFHGVRYDARLGAFDWDYSMNLKTKAKMVSWEEYKGWREYGVAFRKREMSAYEVPNKTLASGVTYSKDGERIQRRGYWGDILNGPFFAYGIECANKVMLETQNGIHKKSANDISYHNVISILHELTTGKEYKHVDNNDVNDDVIIEEVEDEDDENPESDDDGGKMTLPNIKIHLLPKDCLGGLQKKSKFKSNFDVVYFSNSMVHHLNPSIKPLLRTGGLLIVESTLFMLDLKEDMHTEYKKKITAMASTVGCEEARTFNAEKDSFAFFKYNGS